MEAVKKIAIIGHGYVGKAVAYGFDTPHIEQCLIDPIYGTEVDSLAGKNMDVAFVCVPTPMGKNGKIDASIVVDVVAKLKHFDGIIAVKSSVTPDIMRQLAQNEKVVYNPEFLREKSALEDFINAAMLVLGGKAEYTAQIQSLYEKYSRCQPCPVYHMTVQEASFVKYGINSFLATKVVWFNQFKDLADQYQANYDTIIQAMCADGRIGHSHLQVPGVDGKKGFGGACFPKDTKAFAAMGGEMLSILDAAISANDQYRG